MPNNYQIDNTQDCIFSWNYNGSNLQMYYQVQIYNNLTNTLIYNSGKLLSNDQHCTVPATTLTSNTIYKWRVITYDSIDNASYSQWTLFYCNRNPTLTIGSTPSNSQTFEFSALYSQIENIAVKWYQVFLYLSAQPNVIISNSDIIYPNLLITNNTTPLTYVFDVLENNNTYIVKFICENQLGYIIDCISNPFTITYSHPPSISNLVITPNNNNGSISCKS